MTTNQPPVQWVMGLPSPGVKWPVQEMDPSTPSSADITYQRGRSPALRMRLCDVSRKNSTFTFFFFLLVHNIRFRLYKKSSNVRVVTNAFEAKWPDKQDATVWAWAQRHLRHWVNTVGNSSHQTNRPPSIQSQGEREIGDFRSRFTLDVPKN